MVYAVIVAALAIAFLLISEKIFEGTNYYKNADDEFAKLKGDGKVDFVNTGSTFAFYGIDYGSCGVNGLNLALIPQSIENDFRMLKHYEHRYHDGAWVLIAISDLAFAKKGYTQARAVEKYYKLLKPGELGAYHALRAARAKYLPVAYSWKNFLRFCRDVKRDVEYGSRVNEHDEEGVAADAYKRCMAWAQEFSLSDFQDGSQADKFIDSFKYTTQTVSEMIAWCLEKGYRPVLVNLPVSSQMLVNFSGEFLNAFYYDNIKAANQKKVPFIDLQEDPLLSDYLLYLDSCRLNKAGREVVTRLLLRQVGLLAGKAGAETGGCI